MIALVDIDGTISDSRWRDNLIPDWDAFHAASEHDRSVAPMIRLVNCLALLGNRVVYVTGRTERWRAMTLDWMLRHRVLGDSLLMRPDQDYRPAPDLKLALAREHFGPDLAGVGLVIDDSDAVLECFRGLGITTLAAGLAACSSPTL